MSQAANIDIDEQPEVKEATAAYLNHFLQSFRNKNDYICAAHWKDLTRCDTCITNVGARTGCHAHHPNRVRICEAHAIEWDGLLGDPTCDDEGCAAGLWQVHNHDPASDVAETVQDF